jgi:hypothetical protein
MRTKKENQNVDSEAYGQKASREKNSSLQAHFGNVVKRIRKLRRTVHIIAKYI